MLVSLSQFLNVINSLGGILVVETACKNLFPGLVDYAYCRSVLSCSACASGTGQDRTAISVINQSGEQIFTSSFNDKNTTQTVDYIEELAKRYKQYNPVIWAEVNGLGKPYCDLLKDRKIKVTEWITSNQSKNELVAHLQVAFEQEKISILGDERQIDELGYYEADYNPKTRVVTYNAPRGLNDDTVVALMISWEAYLSGNRYGRYCVGAV